MRIRTLILLPILSLALIVPPTLAQDKTLSDEPWAEGFRIAGFDGTVEAAAVYADRLYVGGSYRTYGDLNVDGLAAYDGTSWSDMIQEMGQNPGDITAMTVWDGKLVLGCNGGVDDGGVISRYIGVWDGTQLYGLHRGFSGKVFDLAVWNGLLVAAGEFWYTGDNGTVLKYVAYWNGSSWRPFDQGLSGRAECLEVHDGELYVGGRFSLEEAADTPLDGIARWNGAHWEPVSGWTGVRSGYVTSLQSWQGQLYVGGEFDVIEGVPAASLARWDGTAWQAFGGVTSTGTYDSVWALSILDGALLVGGRFTEFDGLPAKGCVLWDGVSWDTMNGGVQSLANVAGGALGAVEFLGDRYVFGSFLSTEDGRHAARLVRWNGVGWSDAPGMSSHGLLGNASGLTMWNGDPVVWGYFTAAGTTLTPGIARWTGSQWESLAVTGFDDNVLAMAEWNGLLVAGGEFTSVDGVPCRHVAVYDGVSWSEPGGGVNADVKALLSHDGLLYAGGAMTEAGGTGVSGLATWNGTSWSDSGGGVNGSVLALAAHDAGGPAPVLAVGGAFNAAGGTPAANLALWDGASWVEPGGGADGPVHALASYHGLVASGEFLALGGVPCDRIGRWDGTTWEQLGNGFTPEECVPIGPDEWECWAVYPTDMVVTGGRLVVTGVSHSSWLEFVSLAVWSDEEHWTPLGSGLSGVAGLAADGTTLWLAGSFSAWDNPHSAGIARWDFDRVPADGDARWWSGFDAGGPGNQVTAMTEHQGRVIMGGFFESVDDQAISGVAAWDGTAWSPLGDGLGRYNGNYPRVNELLNWNGVLYAAGGFSLPPSTDIVLAAWWDGTAWHPLMTGEYLEYVYDLVPAGDDLYLVGMFDDVDGVPADGVALWDDVTLSPVPGTLTGDVYGAAFHDGDLVVGGRLTAVDGAPCRLLARWDGSAWSGDVDGFGLDGYAVYDLLDLDGTLHVGGALPGGLRSWNGTEWSDAALGLGQLSGNNPSVRALGVFQGGVVAGGTFQLAAGEQIGNNIAHWDGAAWHGFGSGLDLEGGEPRTFCEFDGDLYVGGTFYIMGDKISPFVARWLTHATDVGDAPSPPGLLRAVPNPFNPATRLDFSVDRTARVRLTVHDVRGHLVRVLLDRRLEAGPHRATWDGRGMQGAPAPSGTYLVRLEAEGRSSVRKVMLLE